MRPGRETELQPSDDTTVRLDKIVSPGAWAYSRVEFYGTHYGEPKYRGNGIKSRTKHTATGCEASFVLKYKYYDKVLKIHMVYNHPTTPLTYSQEYQVKRFTQTQKEHMKSIIQWNLLKYGGSTDEMAELIDSIEDLQQHGQVKVVVSDNGSGNVLDILAFSTHHMKDFFNKYPRPTIA
ncbi:hypothetical protein PoB_003555800 [Plakobranchus ocellatus]|uniref:Uncharacterized protein n=1 Tax=Plakobranchus ocellatus TaxID=259542 RepID=A0AAV4ANX8_9GAST|nr:hypothetical protein PoB_003555800 [Plakobranchus ocellatus]